jgi:hypothetical protein
MKPSPSEVSVTPGEVALSEALQGAVFPLSCRQLVWLARENDASSSLLSLLSSLTGPAYGSVAAVRTALSPPPPGAEGAVEALPSCLSLR